MNRNPRTTMPVRTFWLSEIPTQGIRARKGCCLQFAVEGRGKFPEDMLRKDDAQVYDPEDQAMMKTQSRNRLISIIGLGCTAARWESFGWKVHMSGVGEYACTVEEWVAAWNGHGASAPAL